MAIPHLDPAAAPSATDYVLPGPPRSPGLLLVDRESVGHAPVGGGSAVLRPLGERLLLLLDCHQQFLQELRESVATIDESVADESRARLKAQIRHLGEVLGWCEEVHRDLRQEGEAALAGRQPCDPTAISREAAAAATLLRPQQPVVVLGSCNQPWWGSPDLLAQALGQALELVAQRTDGHGGRVVEIGDNAAGCNLRVRGTGDGSGAVEAALVSQFRWTAERLRAAVVPDEQGCAGSGLVLRLSNRSPAIQVAGPAAPVEAAAS